MYAVNKVRRSVAMPEMQKSVDHKGHTAKMPHSMFDKVALARLKSLHASTVMLTGGSFSEHSGPAMVPDPLQPARLFGESKVDRAASGGTAMTRGIKRERSGSEITERTILPDLAETPEAMPGRKARTRASSATRLAVPGGWQQIFGAISTSINRHQVARAHNQIGFKDADIQAVATRKSAGASAVELCNVHTGAGTLHRNVLDVSQGKFELITPRTASKVSGLFSSGFASCVMIAVVSDDKQYLLLSHEDDHDVIKNNGHYSRGKVEEESGQDCSVTLGFCLEAYLEDAIAEALGDNEPVESIQIKVENLARTVMANLRTWASNLDATLIDLPRSAVFLERGTGHLELFSHLPETTAMDPLLEGSLYWHEKQAQDLSRAEADVAYEASGDEA